MPPHFLAAAVQATVPWGLHVRRSARWLATHVELAGDSRTRRRGLLGRAGLPGEHALVIAPSQGVHTVGMRFAIDVIGVARDGRVVSIAAGVKPWRLALSWRAYAIVETAAGRAAAVGLAVGDELQVRPLMSDVALDAPPGNGPD